MNDNRDAGPARRRATEDNQVIQVLSLEYQTLRAELFTRMSGRFQFLGFMTTAAALVIAGIGGGRADSAIRRFAYLSVRHGR